MAGQFICSRGHNWPSKDGAAGVCPPCGSEGTLLTTATCGGLPDSSVLDRSMTACGRDAVGFSGPCLGSFRRDAGLQAQACAEAVEEWFRLNPVFLVQLAHGVRSRVQCGRPARRAYPPPSTRQQPRNRRVLDCARSRAEGIRCIPRLKQLGSQWGRGGTRHSGGLITRGPARGPDFARRFQARRRQVTWLVRVQN